MNPNNNIPRYLRSCKECILCIDDGEGYPYCLENYLVQDDVIQKYLYEKPIQCVRNMNRDEYEKITDDISIRESMSDYEKMEIELKRKRTAMLDQHP